MPVDFKKVLFTGGNGLLCSEIKKYCHEAIYTTKLNFDVTNVDMMENFISGVDVDTIVHAAAFTSPPACDKKPVRAIEDNIIGTANVVKLCIKHNLRIIYISTDYVFRGDRGMYCEDDLVYPVNKYAWSKLGGECAVRMYDNHLIIRTTFGPSVFQYDKAFVDQWTSRESVTQICRRIIGVLKADIMGTIHVGGSRRTVMDYAKSLDPDREIGEISINDIDFVVPEDTSLDCSKYHKIVEQEATEK